jgi:Family of unknown function (DUF6492)
LTTTKQISAIMALKTKGRHYPHNVGRCDILFESLRRFMDKGLISEFIIIVPPEEAEEIAHHARAWADFPIRLLPEDKYLEKFKEFNKWYEVRPWHRQQVIKLFCAELVENDYFIVFDPDMFATQAFGYEDLIIDGKSLVQTEAKQDHVDWWESSAKILGVTPNMLSTGLCVTPEILSKEACVALTRRISEKHQKSWYEVLLSMYTINWTEYTLYWTHLESEALINKFHMLAPRPGGLQLHASQNVWLRAQFDSLEFSLLFSNRNKGIFCTIQSNTGVTPEDILTRISPWISLTLQKYRVEVNRVEKAKELVGAVIRRVMQKLGL